MARILQSDIERVRDSTDIIQLISEYIPLRKAGREFRGPCPFHQEKDPSFFVNPSKGVFFCYGCKASGGVFHFVMEMEKLTFNEAVERLADRLGYRVEYEDASPEEKQRYELKDRLYKADKKAGEYYQFLLTHSRDGKKALEYLHGRHVTDEVIEEYKLGYAPNAWDKLSQMFLDKSWFTEDETRKAGLAKKREKKEGIYDVFRNRVMFPIQDHRGRVVAFSGRSMPGSEDAKYINSPETLIYKKGDVLYGLTQALKAIQDNKEAIVVEGNFDLIVLRCAGITNIVATLGTAITKAHFDLLGRSCEKVYFAFDGDTAGRDAMEKALDLWFKSKMDVFVIVIPEGQDPASLVEEQGLDAFLDYKANAVSLPDFVVDRIFEKHNTSTPKGKERALDACKIILEKVSKPEMFNVRNDLVRKISSHLDVPVESVAQYLKTTETTVPEDGKPSDIWKRVEDESLAVLLHYPEVLIDNHYLDDDYFIYEDNKEVIRILLELVVKYDEEDLIADYDSIVGRAVEEIEDQNLRGRITELILQPVPDNLTKASKTLERLAIGYFKRKGNEISIKLEKAKKGTREHDQLWESLVEINQIIKQYESKFRS